MTDVRDRYEKERECQNRQAGPRRPVLCFEPTDGVPPPPPRQRQFVSDCLEGRRVLCSDSSTFSPPLPTFSEKPCCVFATQLLENTVVFTAVLFSRAKLFSQQRFFQPLLPGWLKSTGNGKKLK